MLKLLFAAALFHLPGTAVQATTFTVTAGNYSFSPSSLTINAGDTVTFKNAGGFHNVHSTSGPTSFKCSNDCTSNNAPSSNAWSDTITFPTAGTVHYQCDEHASMGMTGSIVVNAAASSLSLGGYLSGNWYDPSPNQAGHGFQLEFTNAPGVTAGNKVLVAIWFVFTPDGNPQWVYGQGEWNPNTNTATIPAEIYSGAKFPPNYNANDRQQLTYPPGWGTLTFTFSGCNDGTAAWAPSTAAMSMGYGTGTIPIKRITQIDGTTCPQ